MKLCISGVIRPEPKVRKVLRPGSAQEQRARDLYLRALARRSRNAQGLGG